MKSKHKHRRSSSITLQQHKENAQINDNQHLNRRQIQKQMYKLFAGVEVMEFINNSSQKVTHKQTIVEELHEINQIQLKSLKRKKDLRQIQQDLRDWDQFEVNFLNHKMLQNIKTEGDIRNKTYYPKKNIHRRQKHEDMPKPQLDNLIFKQRRILNKK